MIWITKVRKRLQLLITVPKTKHAFTLSRVLGYILEITVNVIVGNEFEITIHTIDICFQTFS